MLGIMKYKVDWCGYSFEHGNEGLVFHTNPLESELSCRVWFLKTAGVEAKGQCQCGPGSQAEDLWTTEDTVDGDPAAASHLHGNIPWMALERTNGTEPLRKNLAQKQQNPLGLLLGFYGQHHTVGHRGSKTGGWSVYETMASALRCGLRAGPHSSRRSWRVPSWTKDGGVSWEGNESRGRGNLQACPTKTLPPTGLPWNVPGSVGPSPGPGNEGGAGPTPAKADTERRDSPPDRGRLSWVNGRSATEDGKRHLWPRPPPTCPAFSPVSSCSSSPQTRLLWLPPVPLQHSSFSQTLM